MGLRDESRVANFARRNAGRAVGHVIEFDEWIYLDVSGFARMSFLVNEGDQMADFITQIGNVLPDYLVLDRAKSVRPPVVLEDRKTVGVGQGCVSPCRPRGSPSP